MLIGLAVLVSLPAAASPRVLVTADSVQIAWDPNPPGDNVTGYVAGFADVPNATVVCPTNGDGDTFVPVPNGTSLTLTVGTLTPGRSYCLRVYAINANGRSNASNTVGPVTLSSTPPPPDTVPPTMPASLSGTVTPTSATLSWALSTDNIAVVRYELRRGSNAPVTLTPLTLTYTETGLKPGTVLNYSLVAVDAAGNVSPAATVTLTTPLQCTNGGIPYSIVLAVQDWTKTIEVGNRGRVLFQLANPFPITTLQVRFGAQVVGEVRGEDFRDQAGMYFSVPRTAGVYPMTLFARDVNGCTAVTTTLRQVTVQ